MTVTTNDGTAMTCSLPTESEVPQGWPALFANLQRESAAVLGIGRDEPTRILCATCGERVDAFAFDLHQCSEPPPDEPTLYLGLVSPENIAAARAHILAAFDGLRGLSTTINAYCYDDQFGGPNAATEAIGDLELALAALSGGAS